MTAAGDGAAASLQAYADDLLALARAAIDHGLAHGDAPEVDASAWPAPLRAERAAFVTLLDGNDALRGCVGSVEAHRPLVADVAANAFAAAFLDPRFPPLTPAERPGVACKLSVLTPPEPLPFASETDLLQRLQPGVDGLVLEAGERRGTLLPAVWEQIPEPAEFWRMLKRKAGLEPDACPDGLAVYRYRAETLG